MLATTTLRALAIAAALAVSAIAFPAAAQPNPAFGPYYATPSWNQTLPVNLRFIVLANMNHEAVLDRETGLVWEQSPATFTTNWVGAHHNCNRSGKGGRLGWRLPFIQELASLRDPTVPHDPGPTLPPGHPFSNVQSWGYWSATTSAFDADFALFQQFGRVSDDYYARKSDSDLFYVWCVRGGHGSDTQ
jgi:hypothetical protein